MLYIKIAVMAFKCRLCDNRVMKGDAYIQDERGGCTCFCVLPTRRLKPLNRPNHAVKA